MTELDLSTLISAQLAHFEDLVGQRILIDGVPVLVAASAAQSIGMAGMSWRQTLLSTAPFRGARLGPYR